MQIGKKRRLLRIKSRGGTAFNTVVLLGRRRLLGVQKVEVLPIEVGGFVIARITCRADVDMDILAELAEKVAP